MLSSLVGSGFAGLLGVALMAGPAVAQEWLSPRPLNQSQPAPAQQPRPAHPQAQQRPAQPQTPQRPAQQQAQQQPAQQPQGQATPVLVEEIGDWRLQCFNAPSKFCQVSQRQVNPQTQAMIVWIELTLGTQPKPSSSLSLMVPLGIRIGPALNLQADKAPLAALPIITCVPAGCMHQGEVNNNTTAAMQKAQVMTTQVNDMAGRPQPFNFPMRGFREAYAKSTEFLRSR